MKRIFQTVSQKWPEYIIEVIVLIIGIYGAFALQNWKEEGINKKRIEEILIQIQSDMEDNLIDIDGDLSRLEASHLSAKRVEEYLEKDLPYEKSMCFDFYFLTVDDFTTANTTGYENLKDYGIGLLKNDSLRHLIRVIYERALPRLSPTYAFYEDLDTFFGAYYNKHFVPNTDSLLEFEFIVKGEKVHYPQKEKPILENEKASWVTIGYVPLDFEALKKDAEFRMLLKRAQKIRDHKLLWYRRSKERIEFAIKAIDDELEKL